MSDPIDLATEAILNTRAFQAAAAFGVPEGAYEECARLIASELHEKGLQETGVKVEDGQQMYHAYIRDACMGQELLASGPKEWVTQKAYDWLIKSDYDPESEVFIARIEEKLDVEEFIAKGEQ